ncbi:DUF4397 domain-containing protein [Anaerosacchariphilus polymeriproducens]|uniref:DUF4397 domain-containing protein n=1 Tax=Anaerosacchariphilus polymeriproducens TaxID=1812858 RepID=A0A371AZ51_9FIRM|nr:DUF4397 domain-containing protein [Anaerosacchariphilus polymeriproducens]RDU24878.1 DUF4397 domain-containing protein [Anaerosacchariphilus polymeriproducens]
MYNKNNRNNLPMGSIGYVRVMHTVPDAPNVDIYANDELIAENLTYGEYTDYLPIPQGIYMITLYAAGSEDAPILSNLLMVHGNCCLTVAAMGMLNNINFIAISDADAPLLPNRAMVRFMHLSPDAPAVYITLPDGTLLFNMVSFGQITPYTEVMPMNYTLDVKVAGTTTTVLTVPDVNLSAGKYYTIYAIGLADGSPELEALLLEDGL